MRKNAEALSLQTIIIFIIAVLVLVVVVIAFRSQFGSLVSSFSDIIKNIIGISNSTSIALK